MTVLTEYVLTLEQLVRVKHRVCYYNLCVMGVSMFLHERLIERDRETETERQRSSVYQTAAEFCTVYIYSLMY